MYSNSARSGPGADETGPTRRGGGTTVEEIELQSAILVRHFEMLRRRSDIYSQLDRAEYLLLRTLDAAGPTDICGLAAALGLDPSTAGRQVTAMEAHGLVHRTPSRTDRRRSIVEPSALGRRRMEEVRARRTQVTADLLAGWTDDELRTLAEMFTRYNGTVARHYLSP